MADMPSVLPAWQHPTSPRRRAWLGWLLSLALHSVVLVGLVCFCRFFADHPAGGGGGTGGGGGSVLAVDLSGLGADEGGPLPGSDAAAGADEMPAAEETTSPQARQEATPEEASENNQEKALPVLAKPSAHAVKTKTEQKQCVPRKKRPPHAAAVATVPASVSGQGSENPGGSDASQAGPSGVGPGTTGGVSGQGGGTGGGSGGGEGPAVGAGRGMGEDGGMSLAAVDVKPRIMRQVEPAYPADARRHGIEGRVVARLLVAADGGVNKISIVSAKPPQIFEQAVITALEKWRFHPARYKGREVASWVMLPIRFDLK